MDVKDTKTINLRDLPGELVRRAKAYAALRGFTLRDFVISLIEKGVEQDIPPIGKRPNNVPPKR